MPLILVRHALAVPRPTWTGRDVDRPLTATGERQAEQLIRRCTQHRIHQILCSPALRCVQTVQPLARQRGITVQPHPDLGEGRRAAAREVVAALQDAAALVCTHADVLDALVRRLVRPGLPVAEAPSWANVEAWVLDHCRPTPRLTRLAAPPSGERRLDE